MFAWEISIKELKNGGALFKVTRRLPALHVAETKMFRNKDEAKKQLEEWLQNLS
ncbi:MAG: hypothetical protein Q7R76_02170 [Candidatus Woesearchaeota archaeon]|nr:hypothetical protein [Candidatus Woesearchaeota archaeon]